MRRYQLGAHTKTDLKVHLIWVPKYRKRVLTGAIAIRARDVLRQIALEHEIDIITGKISIDHSKKANRLPMIVDLKSTPHKTPRLIVEGCSVLSIFFLKNNT